MFVATANILDPIPPALRDRMEIIELPGYTREEKLHDLASSSWSRSSSRSTACRASSWRSTTPAVAEVIDSYTREAGVRNLEREMANVIRGVAVKVAEGKAKPQEKVVDRSGSPSSSGPPSTCTEVAERTAEPGVATGLAWTPVGGDILFIEATKMTGKGKLMLTGQLGDVMKESAQAALSFIRVAGEVAGARGRTSSRRATSTSTSRRAPSPRTVRRRA